MVICQNALFRSIPIEPNELKPDELEPYRETTRIRIFKNYFYKLGSASLRQKGSERHNTIFDKRTRRNF